MYRMLLDCPSRFIDGQIENTRGAAVLLWALRFTCFCAQPVTLAVRYSPVPVRTVSGFRRRYPIWSVVRVVQAARLAMINYRGVCGLLVFRGFVVVSWLVARCRWASVWTDSDVVV